jgi:hypothetical protein
LSRLISIIAKQKLLRTEQPRHTENLLARDDLEKALTVVPFVSLPDCLLKLEETGPGDVGRALGDK